MLFNSIEYLIFLPLVFLTYWTILKDKTKLQNLFVLVASYVFYGWWDWRFLGLILFSTITDYTLGQAIYKSDNALAKKRLLILSLVVNLGLLGFFKYYNFFVENFVDAFGSLGIELNARTLSLILPIGISFYTFQTLSYTIDVYRERLKPTNDFIAFAAFISFFPQLVAGPIERASNLLPQFFKSRQFTYDNGVDGLRQILWGLFKKVVIADNCAVYVNYIFENSADLNGITLLIGAVLFAFQIYGDFSGYSDIAIGSAKLLGFNLMQNFSYPYFSRDIAEFWRRWHISLSSWFKDYLYIPLGGSRLGKFSTIRNVFIIFIVSGFWHGANWTYLFWGFLNAVFFLPLLLSNKNRSNLNVVAEGKYIPKLSTVFRIAITFSLTCLAWIFFRANDLSHAFDYVLSIISNFQVISLQVPGSIKVLVLIFPLIILMNLVEWLGRAKKHALEQMELVVKNGACRFVVYLFLIFIIAVFGGNLDQEFVYFQF